MNRRVAPGGWGRQLLFGWLHVALALPSIYLLLGLPLVMREQGWSGTEIGLFQLAGLPALGKVLLALPVQRYRAASGHYRAWAMGLCLLLALLLVLISQQGMAAPRLWLFGLALTASLLATWADIPVNALAIKLLPGAQQVRAGSIRSAALFLGAIVGGGVMLLVHSRWGWEAPFGLMAAVLLGALVLLWRLDEGHEAGAEVPRALPLLATWSGFFRQPGARLWSGVLLGGFPFVGAAWLYLKPLLLDRGMAMEQVAWVAGVGGGLVGALASLWAARLIRRWGLGLALPVFLGGALLALVGLGIAVYGQVPLPWLVLAALCLATAMGAVSTLVFGVMMALARDQRQAADYGLQASLFVLGRLLVPIAAGWLLDRGGYPGMLAGLSLGMLLVWLAVLAARGSLVPVSSADGRPQS